MPANSGSRSDDSAGKSTKTDTRGPISRRGFLTSATGASVVALAGCMSGPSGSSGDSEDGGSAGTETGGSTGNSSKKYAGKTLSVATWAGIYAKAFEQSVAKSFEEKTGATVEVNPAGGSILSEIKSAPADNPPYDVAAAEGFFYWQGRKEDLFLEVRDENVPNLDGVYDYLKNLRGTKYGVPTDGSLEGIIYRDDIGWDPSTWSDLLTEKKGTSRIGFEGSWYIYPLEVSAVSLNTASGIQELYDSKHHPELFDRMRAFGQNVELWTGSFAEIESSLRQHIIDMSMWYSGMGNAAAAETDSLKWTTPSQTAGYLDHYCPVRGTDKRDMAEDFLNHMLDPAVQEKWASEGYVYTSNRNVDYPDRVADQYPTSASEWKAVKIANFNKLSEYSSKLSSKFQEIKRA